MRVLLSTIGSRGDVQPLVALATHLKSLGHEVRLCEPPDFRGWIDVLGLPVAPIGPELRRFTTASTGKPALPSAEQRRQMVEGTVATQFETIAAVAKGCDILVGATALQIAAPSVAEKRGIPYVFAAYCPAVLPSPHHAPPPLPPIPGQTPWPATTDNRELWAQSAARFNQTFGTALNAHRAAMGLPPVGDVSRHVFTDRPWLAADAVLGPWPDPKDEAVFQTGAWILPDERSLTRAIRTFLDAGDPPIYFGFGSMRAPLDTGKVVIEAARALGRRAIVSRGWAELSLADNQPDCLAIDEANLDALFKRTAAVVHHGGAGTTTAAARAGVPQVVIPQMYDQHYWAKRVHELGIGIAHASATPTVESLTIALGRALLPGVAASAQGVSSRLRSDGTQVAAAELLRLART